MNNVPSPSFDTVAGCLFGGAFGDSLGYTVEFWNRSQIEGYFGPGGPERLNLKGGAALVSDDTQMSILTADAVSRHQGDDEFLSDLWNLYREWGAAQFMGLWNGPRSPLNALPFMRAERSPGMTCLSAISLHEEPPVFSSPVNGSKGCGGVMRVAPVGFEPLGYGDIARRAVIASACTHGHPLGYLPSAVLACIVARAYRTSDPLEDVILSALRDTEELVSSLASDLVVEGQTVEEHMRDLRGIIEKAIHLARSDICDRDCLDTLGEGWVAEETLAIAVFCALRHEGDFVKAVRVSVTHDGDSDSCGAVTGNILGVREGFESITSKTDVESLECYDTLVSLSRSLSEPL